MIDIRSAKPLDFEKVYEIECEVNRYPWGMLDFYEDFINNPRSIWFVAESDGQVVGFAGMWRGVEELHIVNIAVANRERGKGLGKALVQRMMQQAEEESSKTVLLEVRKSNDPAINLYRQFGFRELYLRKGYYQEDGEDGIVMVRDLK